MSSRLDFFFRQKVTEAELDLAFALIEKADHNLAVGSVRDQLLALLDPSTQQDVTTLADAPGIVAISYNYVDSGSGLPRARTYVYGALTPDLRCWVTKIDMGGGDKDYRITIRNNSTCQLWINVAAYRSHRRKHPSRLRT